ncbi:MAG: hypothetical protein ACOC5T_02655 [Elusimicrobiota bacterium]
MPGIELVTLNIGVGIIIFLQTLQVKYLWKHETRISAVEACLFGNPLDATDESLTEKVIENHTMMKLMNTKLNKIEEKLFLIHREQKDNNNREKR